MLTRQCIICERLNTVLRPLTLHAQVTNQKCKYHQAPGTLAGAVETNPYVTPVPGKSK